MKKTLHRSTALAVIVSLSAATPAPLAFAQEAETEVDCTVTPDAAECAAEAETQPAEETTPEEETVEEAPAAEESVEEAPAAEEAVEEPVEESTEEAPAAEETTEPAAEAEPVEEETAPVEETVEEAPATEEAPAAVQQAEEPVEEEPAAEDAAESAPAAEEPAPEELPVEESADEPSATQLAPAAEEEMPAEEPVENADAPVEEQAIGEIQEAQPLEEPPAVVPDEMTETQVQQFREQEQESRDESRRRRLELLGAAAAGAVVGALVPALGGRVVEDQGDRIIVERDGRQYVRKDESAILREGDVRVTTERLRGGRTREIIERQNGVRIETIRDQGGFVLRRSRITPDGREIVLIDNRDRDEREYVDYREVLGPLEIDIPRDRYIVPARGANRQLIYDTFTAPPVEQVEQAYTLRQVRESERLRDMVRRVDLDTINFALDSAAVSESQVPLLEDMALAANELIDQDPDAILLVEGHTDAVGGESYNLALSDRRAETVARILAGTYGVPPENMVIQGYGEQYLKVDTQEAERENRRVTIRNISPLLQAQNQ